MERKYFRSLTDEERKQLKKNIFQKLKISETEEKRKIPVMKLAAIGIAASVLIAVGLLTLRTDTRVRSEKIFIARTTDGETKQILLSDSSVVVLNAGSELYSNSDYATGEREVFLTGNGFFKVKKLASHRKFIVHAKTLRVTVLGTQFNVNARTDQVSVALTSGKVQVNKMEDDKPAYMLPGDRLKLDANKTSFTREQKDTSMYSAWIKGEWNFKNLTLEEIALLIEEYYNVDVVFKDEKKMNQQMTAVIPVNTLQGLIKVITATLDVEISQNNNKQLTIQ
jgi:ferric-dicitrate binding protein FerR (iron transport regulator)